MVGTSADLLPGRPPEGDAGAERLDGAVDRGRGFTALGPGGTAPGEGGR